MLGVYSTDACFYVGFRELPAWQLVRLIQLVRVSKS